MSTVKKIIEMVIILLLFILNYYLGDKNIITNNIQFVISLVIIAIAYYLGTKNSQKSKKN
ncbi:hypothetical protein [Companilactobacillus mishanensis]|uniref:hypothetical protein n=1 Tax=Companilactobacillus mishanensis TaxID=2486008 RepID=UPI00129797FE|nr:hypothetical protein [Companilactobacillus mishanensis]MQS90178.1 hypothetical protein [Companilactobacillus mishanensis]